MHIQEKLYENYIRITWFINPWSNVSDAQISTKTEVIKYALENIIQREKIKGLTGYYGKLNLDIDLDKLRNRWIFLLILPHGLSTSEETKAIRF